MNLQEARELEVGDVVTHVHLKSEWVVIEAKPTKSNLGTFRHVLQLKDCQRKQRFTEKQLHMWKSKWQICQKCNGDGKGSGCFEQGGFIRGLCPDCNGYGKWLKGD